MQRSPDRAQLSGKNEIAMESINSNLFCPDAPAGQLLADDLPKIGKAPSHNSRKPPGHGGDGPPSACMSEIEPPSFDTECVCYAKSDSPTPCVNEAADDSQTSDAPENSTDKSAP